MGEERMHFDHCPVPMSNLAEGQKQPPCECVKPAIYHGAVWSEEDVEHIDEAISEIKVAYGAIALPGLEYVRNMVAVRAGVEPKPLGWDNRKEELEDD